MGNIFMEEMNADILLYIAIRLFVKLRIFPDSQFLSGVRF